MIITLNESIEPIPQHPMHECIKEGKLERASSAAQKHASLLAGLDYYQLEAVKSLNDSSQAAKMGVLDTISTAYDKHLNLVINPHDLWYMVLTQIAEEINLHPKQYEHLFTSKPDQKLQIIVPQDHLTDINLGALVDKLAQYIPGGPDQIDLFLPELTTLTDNARRALAAAFLSCARKYYDYGMFCCGIPAIDLRGTNYDWINLRENLVTMIDFFHDSPRMIKYLTRVLTVFNKIVDTFEIGVDLEFWQDIYTHKNVGSGGDLRITGWIKLLYLAPENHDLLKSFHDCMSGFEYENVSSGEKFVMVHGAFGSTIEDNSISAEYDYMTFRVLKEPNKPVYKNGIQVVKEKL